MRDKSKLFGSARKGCRSTSTLTMVSSYEVHRRELSMIFRFFSDDFGFL
jgi:hypothetical protein